MKILLAFCCLSAVCVIRTEANPFFFNLQRTIIPQTTQIRAPQPVAVQRTNFGLGGLLSKWSLFPRISINKQIGTRRPKATQRPVIEVTTVFVPTDLEKVEHSTTEVPAEKVGVVFEKRISTSVGPVEKVDRYSIEQTSTTAAEEPIEDISTDSEEKTSTTTTTTTTAVPFEEIEPFTESKTTTTTTELPFEETEPLTEGKIFTTTTTQVPERETKNLKITTNLRFGETGPLNATKTVTTKSNEIPAVITETKTSTNEVPEVFTESKPSTTEVAEVFLETDTSTTQVPELSTQTKPTTTTTELPFEVVQRLSENKIETPSATTTTEIPFEEIGFYKEEEDDNEAEQLPTKQIISTTYTTSSSSSEQPSDGSSNTQVQTIEPTTYRPTFTPTTTNAPWKETPQNIINTGGLVNPNKPLETYYYVRPAISVEDILLNEVSPRARAFETDTGVQIEEVDKPEAKREIDDRPLVTFYSNY